MSLVLTPEQEMLRHTAREFIRAQAPISHFRALRDKCDSIDLSKGSSGKYSDSMDPLCSDGFSRELWHALADLGLVGLLFPEEVGGMGLGFAELGLVLEELGVTLAVTPFMSTVLLSGGALMLGGTAEQQQALLPEVCTGEKILALAFQEGPRFAPYHCATTAQTSGTGFVLQGEKVFVLDGHCCDQLVVVARTSGQASARDGLTLFLVDANAPGITRTRTRLVDSRNAARIRLEQVSVDSTAVVGELGRGADLLDQVLDRATIALSSEMLGSAQEVFERTIAYLKERKQYGVPIGSFQALKHRAAQLYGELELARSAVLDALRGVDEARAEVPKLASIVKAQLSDVYLHIANESIQMHGGIGVTDELDIGFFLKRAKVCEQTFGDAAWHRRRYATLEGY